jgi:hypothetical protein
MTTTALIVWAIVATILGVKSRRARTVFFGGCLLAAIPIAISQREYGFQPMAGVLHIFASGLYPLGLFAFLKRYGTKQKPFEPPSKENV